MTSSLKSTTLDNDIEGTMDLQELSKSDDILEAMNKELQHLEEESVTRPFGLFIWKSPSVFTAVLACFASIGGLLYGIDLTLISGANLYFPKDLHLSSGQESQVVSFMPLGGVLGALMIYLLNESLGRKPTIMIAAAFYTIGGILEAASQSYGMLISARLIVGVGVGIELGSVPMYIAECSTKRWRGGLVSLYQLMINFGMLLGYADSAIFHGVPGNWRYMLGSCCLFSVILLVGMIFFPESPRWLMRRGRKVDSYITWKKIRGFEEREEKEEFFYMEEVVTEERDEAAKRVVWKDFLIKPRCRRAAVVSLVYMILCQFTGISSISYYMSTLMEKSGLSPDNALYTSMGPGFVYFGATIPAVFLMDAWGRRAVILTLLPGIVIGDFITGFSFLATKTSVKEGIYVWGICTYYLFWGSWGPAQWVITSEVFPTYLRSHGVMLNGVVNMLSNFATAYPFTRMLSALTPTGLFCGFYAGICVLLWIFSFLFVPETKGKTLEEINAIYNKSHWDVCRENLRNGIEAFKDIIHGNWNRVWVYQRG
ncbi:hypothetical protein GpartN1_g5401.t1 [Galdieria partita]|uniref:Major facilitator superfamily (MFS) profile domain-containing protein n=1 Tax=Galdieria partita TaxID=83374 RepID=A0A9C7Q046_9RHOD|nr:hypothetical protein GpartN1_g5401.t1 [Galdieria partita]